MHLTRVTVFLDGHDFASSATYMVVASSAHEAAKLVTDHLNLRHPWGPIKIDVLTNQRADGPPRVLVPVSDGVKARQ